MALPRHQTLLLALFLVWFVSPCPAADEFSVKESGDNLELVTPWGTKTLVGDIGFKNNGNYRIEIPIEDLKPVFPSKPNYSDKNEDEPQARKRNTNSKEDVKDDEDDDDAASEPTKKDEKDRQPQAVPAPQPPLKVEYDDTDKLVVEANHLYNQGRFFEASEDIEEILRKNPDYIRGWIMKGSLMYVQNEKDLAKKAWEKALNLDPQNQQVKALLERYK